MTVAFKTDSHELYIDHILNFSAEHINKVAVPAWINSAPSIMSVVWSKTKEKLIYTLRLTDMDLFIFIVFMAQTLIKITDNSYYSGEKWAWVDGVMAIYEGEINAELPWKVNITLIVVGNV